MAIIQLHGNFLSVHTQNVMACFHEKQIDYEVVSMNSRPRIDPSFLAMNPFGQMPIIRDGDLTLFESRAIIKYLAEKYVGQGSNLLGRTLEERAVVEQWCEVESQRFSPSYDAIFGQILMVRDANQIQTFFPREELPKVFDIYEKRLSECAYLAGDFFSVADLLHLSHLHILINHFVYKKLITSRENVSAWWARISSRPAWEKVSEMAKRYGRS